MLGVVYDMVIGGVIMFRFDFGGHGWELPGRVFDEPWNLGPFVWPFALALWRLNTPRTIRVMRLLLIIYYVLFLFTEGAQEFRAFLSNRTASEMLQVGHSEPRLAFYLLLLLHFALNLLLWLIPPSYLKALRQQDLRRLASERSKES